MSEKVVVPLDGSARAEAVLTRFRKLMSRQDSELVLVHAVDRSLAIDEVASETAWQTLWDAGQDYAQEIVARLTARGARASAEVRPGRPAEVILEAARETGATLIAMTTHGRAGLSRWALGSVAEKVLRASAAPILLCRSFDDPKRAEDAHETILGRMLVPVDEGSRSLEVVPPAARLAKLYGSKVLLLHVSEPDRTGTGVELIRARELFEAEGIVVDVARRTGDPAEVILDECRTSRADLIAMTTHGRSGVARWALGSVAEKVLRSGTAPMLLVRGFVPATFAFGG